MRPYISINVTRSGPSTGHTSIVVDNRDARTGNVPKEDLRELAAELRRIAEELHQEEGE